MKKTLAVLLAAVLLIPAGCSPRPVEAGTLDRGYTRTCGKACHPPSLEAAPLIQAEAPSNRPRICRGECALKLNVEKLKGPPRLHLLAHQAVAAAKDEGEAMERNGSVTLLHHRFVSLSVCQFVGSVDFPTFILHWL